jgi:hypothetical protein
MAGSWGLLFSVLSLAACVSCAANSDGEKDVYGKVAQEQAIGSAEESNLFYATCKSRHGDPGQGYPQLHVLTIKNLHSRQLIGLICISIT